MLRGCMDEGGRLMDESNVLLTLRLVDEEGQVR